MRRYSRGFTLIELLVVVALIGILSAIGIVSYGKYKTSAEKKQAEISLSSIYLAEQEYKSNNGSYYYNSLLNNIINELFDGVDDLSDQKENLKFSDLELIFKDLRNLFEKRGFIINWKALEHQSLNETINALAMASPFTLEEKQVLLEAQNLDIRKNKIAEILKTYTHDIYENNTIQ